MTKRIIKTFIGTALLTTSMSLANPVETQDVKSEKLCLTDTCISTEKLQKEVEKRTLEGNLPFEMGLELIKRWSNNKLTV